jgi:NTE family protein
MKFGAMEFAVMLWDGIARRSAGSGGGGGTVEAGPPVERDPRTKVKVGLALGGGAARGWCHIGVLRVLAESGIVPDIIAGCSIGAVVGGCYAAGKLDELENFALSLTKRRVMGLLDFHFSGAGLIAGGRLQRLLDQDLMDRRVETLPLKFCTIATELTSGHEIWLTRGPLVQAMRASYALPGVFDPVMIGGRWLMDGALVNPIPITAARALGADIVICVNLNGEVRVRGTVIQSYDAETSDEQEIEEAMGASPRRWGLFSASRNDKSRKPNAPGLATVMVDAFNITQDRIARSRLAGDPPDIMVAPKLAKMGLFEFHRAQECIALGRQATERALPDIMEILQEAQGV